MRCPKRSVGSVFPVVDDLAYVVFFECQRKRKLFAGNLLITVASLIATCIIRSYHEAVAADMTDANIVNF